MKKILDRITEEMKGAFTAAGYDATYGKVTLSNRPDLCEYQCNGAMAAAKDYKKKPIDIANGVVEHLKDSEIFEEVSAVMPGFINLKIGSGFLADYMNGMRTGEKLGMEPAEHPETVIVDYGGANVAKPLHVGHLRSAIIGEAIKRMGRFVGHKVIGDVHLGDWGLQMGLIIEELKERQPELCYFDEGYTGEYPEEPPFTISELEEIYPAASAKSKVDEAFKERAQEATFRLQSGYAPYRAIWNHIMSVSLKDLKKNYSNLNVEFDLWKGESDAQPYIPAMIDDLVEKGLAREPWWWILRRRQIPRSCRPASSGNPTELLFMPPPTWPPSWRGSRISIRTTIFMWWTSVRTFISPRYSGWQRRPGSWRRSGKWIS